MKGPRSSRSQLLTRMWFIPAFAFAGLALSPAPGSDRLVFTGSFWDRGDAFRMGADIGPGPPPYTIRWDGFPENDSRRDKDDSGRIRLTVNLTPEEARPLQLLAEYLPLCHAGHRMVLGTGLLVSASTWREDARATRQGYFHTPPRALLGRRMRDLPLRFQALTADGSVSGEEKKEWLAEARDFARDLRAWSEAITLLEKAREEEGPVPWQEIDQRVLRERPPFTDTPPETEIAFARETRPVLECILSPETRAEYFEELGESPVVVRLDEIARDDNPSPMWSGLPMLPPRGLAGEANDWAVLAPARILFFEDFLVGRRPESGPWFDSSGAWIEHPIWNVPSPAEDRDTSFRERLAFLDSCGWESRLLPRNDANNQVAFLRIFRLAFQEELSRCVVMTHRAGKPLITLLEVVEAEWKVLRQVGYEDWEEYGWREPPFK